MSELDNELVISPTSPGNSSSSWRPLSFDPELYREYLADFDLTEAEWAELLAVLWPIVSACADYGLGLHPLQLVIALASASENLAPDSDAMLASKGSSTKNNNDMAASRLPGRYTGGE